MALTWGFFKRDRVVFWNSVLRMLRKPDDGYNPFLYGAIQVPHSLLPRIVGFELPSLARAADPGDGEPVVGLFDIVPSERWSALFEEETVELIRRHALSRVSLGRERVLLFGAVSDARKLCDDVRALVDRVSNRERDERIAEPGTGGGDLENGSFRRND